MHFRTDLGQQAYPSRFTLTWLLTFQDPASEQLYERTLHQSLPSLLPLVLVFIAWPTAPILLTVLSALLALARWRTWPGTELIALSLVHYSLCGLDSELSTGISALVLCALGKL